MRAYFVSRLLREKILLLTFALLGAAIWLSGAAERASVQLKAIKETSVELDRQSRWLVERQRYEKEAQLAVEHLDPSGSLDSVRLQSELNTMARAAGLTNYDVSDSRTDRTPQFAVNSVQFSARNVDIRSLIRFYEAISRRAPYLGLEDFKLASSPSNPAQLTATWRVTSVEIAR